MDTCAFTNALEIANSSRVDISKAERSAAESYLMALQSTADGLNLSFHILTNESSPISAARFFWATNTILYHLPFIAGTMANDKAEEMYQLLMGCIHRYFLSFKGFNNSNSSNNSTGANNPLSGWSGAGAGFHNNNNNPNSNNNTAPVLSDHIINKHAQVMVAGFQLFFPYGQWNRFLFDILEMRQRAMGQFFEDQVTMYVLRVLEYIDERVVSVRDRVDRVKEQRESDMKIKDAMRETVIPDFVQMWYDILFQSRASHRNEMIKLCLDVVKMYTEWIDIGLLLHDRWIHLLYYFLTLPMYRQSVCECLLSLVNKKQLPDVKRETLLRLHIVEQIPKLMEMLWTTWSTSNENQGVRGDQHSFFGFVGPDMSEEEGSLNALTDAVAMLITAVASQLLSLVDAYNTAIRQQQEGASMEHAESTLAALHDVVFHLVELTAAQQFILPMTEVLNFFQLYVKSTYFTQQEANALLDPLFKRTILHNILTEGPEMVWDEGVIEDRKSVLLVVRLIYRTYPDIVCQHVHQIVLCATSRAENPVPPLPADIQNWNPSSFLSSAVLNSSNNDSASLYYYFASAPFLEATLRYVYEMGSAIRLDTLRDTQSLLTIVIERLLRLGTVCFFTPLVDEEGSRESAFLYGREGYSTGAATVHLGFFETVCRYHLFVVYHRNYLESLLGLLLLNRWGVCHPHEKTRGRICSLLRQLVLSLLNVNGPSGGPEEPKGSPLLPYATHMVKALQSIIIMQPQSNTGTDQNFTANDRRELYEAMGMLLSLAAVSYAGPNDGSSGVEQHIASCQEHLQAIATTLLEQLGTSGQRAAAGFTSTPPQRMGAPSSPMPPLPEELVADSLSFCSAWAKGLRLGYSNSNSVNPSASAVWQQNIASTLSVMLQTIGPIWQRFQFSSAVRDRTGHFFGQLINTIPMYEEALEGPLQQYLVSSLSSPSQSGMPSTSSSDLNRLLRLLHQLVGKAGRQAMGTLQAVIPLVWECMKSVVGPLPSPSTGIGEFHLTQAGGTTSPQQQAQEAAATLPFGVMSESCRECLEVYKNYFLLLVNAATFNCASAVLTLPDGTFQETFEQLKAALVLPADTDVPKSSLQLFSRLLGDISSTSQGPNNSNASGAAVSEEAAVIANQLERLRSPVLYLLVPAALTAFTSSSFDWRDAKNGFLSAEFAFVAQGAVKRFGDDAMQVFFRALSPYVGEETATQWCLQLRAESKVTPGMKSQLRAMLQQIQQMLQN